MKQICAWLFLGSVAALSAADAFAASDCQIFAAAKATERKLPHSAAKISEWADYQSRVWAVWKETALDIFQQYREGKRISFAKCLPTPRDRETIDDILPQVFYEESLKLLRQSQSPSIRALLAAIDAKTQNNQLVLFRLLGHYKEATPPNSDLAGVRRGTGSIFMNFTRIPPNDWLIIFTHEILHSLDQRIFSAVGTFGNQNLVKQIAQAAQDKSTLEEFSESLRAQMDDWLIAGLDRGFLAEYRAWTLTFEIYQDGLKEELWQPISWLDKILQDQGEQDLKSLTFQTLDPKFTDPTDGIFSLPLVSQELINVRAQLRIKIPDLANLETIYSTR